MGALWKVIKSGLQRGWETVKKSFINKIDL